MKSLEDAEWQVILERLNDGDPSLTSLSFYRYFFRDDVAIGVAEQLPRMTVLTSLNFRSNYISDEGAKAIAKQFPQMTTLISLNLGWNSIKAGGIIVIAEQLRYTSLISLDISHAHIDSSTMKIIAEQLFHSSLKSLDISNNEIDANGAKAIAQQLPCSSLTSLNLYWNNIGDNGIKAISDQLPSSSLTLLNLANNGIGANGAKALAAQLPHSSLTSLSLYWNKIGNNGVEAIAEQLPHSLLRSLTLGRDELVKADGFNALAAQLPHSSIASLVLCTLYSNRGNMIKKLAEQLPHAHALTSLRICASNLLSRSSTIHDDEVAAIAAQLSGSSLTSIEFGEVTIGDKGIQALAEQLPHSSLTSFSFVNCFIGSRITKNLVKQLPHSLLTSLSLKRCCIGSDGAKALAEELPHMTTLTSLDLYYSEIGTDGAKAIADQLSRSSLRLLNISHNKIGIDGVQAIATQLPHSSLSSLNLESCGIGNEGVKALSLHLPQAFTLASLNLSNCCISDDGAEALAATLINTAIVSLVLECSNIDDTIRQRLNSQLRRNQQLHDKLHHAIQHASLEKVEALVEQGANLLSTTNKTNDDDSHSGNTPLHLAVLSKHVDIVRYLIQVMQTKKLPFTLRNKNGKTAANLAQDDPMLNDFFKNIHHTIPFFAAHTQMAINPFITPRQPIQIDEDFDETDQLETKRDEDSDSDISTISVASSRFFSNDKSTIAEKLQKRIREKAKFIVTIEDDDHIEVKWREDRVSERDARTMRQTLGVLFCRGDALIDVDATCLRIRWASLRDTQVREFNQKHAEQTLLVNSTYQQRRKLTSISEALSIQKQQRYWSEMLVSISSLLAQNYNVLPNLKTGFISYAWYPGDAAATERLQAKLKVIVETFRSLGLDVYLDIQRMHGNIDAYMIERINQSDVVFVIGTPQLIARATAAENNNLKIEYQHIRARQCAGDCKVIPLLLEGTHEESFPNEAHKPWLGELIYDLRELDANNPVSGMTPLASLENPLGLIPTLWGLRNHPHIWQMYHTAYQLLEHRCPPQQANEEAMQQRVASMELK